MLQDTNKKLLSLYKWNPYRIVSVVKVIFCLRNGHTFERWPNRWRMSSIIPVPTSSSTFSWTIIGIATIQRWTRSTRCLRPSPVLTPCWTAYQICFEILYMQRKQKIFCLLIVRHLIHGYKLRNREDDHDDHK